MNKSIKTILAIVILSIAFCGLGNAQDIHKVIEYVGKGNTESLKKELKKGNIEITKITPYHILYTSKPPTSVHLEIVRLLIDGFNEGDTRVEYLRYVEYGIVNRKAVYLKRRYEKGAIVFMWELKEGHIEMAKLLIDPEADPDIQDGDDTTMLMFALRNHYMKIAKLLIDKEADLNIQDKKGRTALRWAPFFKYEELLDAGADPDIPDNDGQTVLMNASYYGVMKTVKLLIDKEADLYIRNNDGYNAFELAEKRGHKEIAEYIKEKMNERSQVLKEVSKDLDAAK
ncbi:MAG: ankyrin repeat domain-containing protein [Elusimicrobiaceae bacterium]|nr:ankyrin repeat domain-containing protein [Elusimicrobiaceae bacterium]MBT5987943.1 ankyrin repeat domain-containing protein [Elusimicrobiaceae bacterium]MBT7283096.1 ankyrin repeat domain-containing protein [Elusimicrobiaceae bacterium]